MIKSDARKLKLLSRTLRFLLIIDKKNFGEPRDGELKSCDAGSLSGESCKLSEGIYVLLYASILTVTCERNEGL